MTSLQGGEPPGKEKVTPYHSRTTNAAKTNLSQDQGLLSQKLPKFLVFLLWRVPKASQISFLQSIPL